MTRKLIGAGGQRLLKGLFLEMQQDTEGAPYTLKDRDHKGCESLYRLYIEMEDITEWEFANKYLDSYEHWTMLCDCGWFKPYVERWRKELELKLKARALRQVQELASLGDTRDSFQANRFLIEKGFNSETKGKRGRPSKQEIKEAADTMASQAVKLEDDFKLLETKIN